MHEGAFQVERRTFLPKAEFALYRRLCAELSYHQRLRLLVEVPSSQAVDLEFLRKSLTYDEIGVLLRGLIKFLVIRREHYVDVVLALIDQRETGSRPLARLLERLRVPFVRCDFNGDPEEIVGALRSRLPLRPKMVAPPKKFIGYEQATVEWAVGERLYLYVTPGLVNRARAAGREHSLRERQVRARTKLAIWPEIALKAFLAPARPNRKLSREEEFFSHSSVDILISSAGPNCNPLLVVEFDGPYHEDERRREKDAMKDAFLKQAAIPCLRFTSKELNDEAWGTARLTFLLDVASGLIERTKLESQHEERWRAFYDYLSLRRGDLLEQHFGWKRGSKLRPDDEKRFWDDWQRAGEQARLELGELSQQEEDEWLTLDDGDLAASLMQGAFENLFHFGLRDIKFSCTHSNGEMSADLRCRTPSDRDFIHVALSNVSVRFQAGAKRLSTMYVEALLMELISQRASEEAVRRGARWCGRTSDQYRRSKEAYLTATFGKSYKPADSAVRKKHPRSRS